MSQAEKIAENVIESIKDHGLSVVSAAQEKIEQIKESDAAFDLRARLRWLRQWWKGKYVAPTDHEGVIKAVRSEGRLTSRYSFMVIMSCAIAMLGLLLSSPAVVIGAMLISPLMAPIMSLGFSLCLLDVRQMKKALEGLLAGVTMALAISWLIVTFSPITDATSEIMARTQPNLFDLLVAIFSGLAGGYAVIKRKGETIVGVAIATALMPPLAVVGFGLATGSAPIAKGAFMLFMTNLLAISLSVTLLAKFYGFDQTHSPKRTAWQMGLVIAVFGALSLPLGVALKDIAYQTYITKMTKRTIKDYFGEDRSRISVFNIKFTDDKETNIDTVVLTSKYRSKAQPELKKLLVEKTGGDVTFSLDQVVVAHEVIEDTAPKPQAENTIASTLQVQPPRWTRTEEMTNALKQATFFPTDYIKVDVENKLAAIYPKPAKGVTILTLHQFENNLRRRYPGWTIKVIPPHQALPYIYYEIGADKSSEAEAEKIADIIWTLRRWEARQVTVVGFASTVGEFEKFNNTSLAYRRAGNVLEKLKAAGIKAEPRSEYRSFKQRRSEFNEGINSFQRVEVRLNQLPDNGHSELQPAAGGNIDAPVVPTEAPEAETSSEDTSASSVSAETEQQPIEEKEPGVEDQEQKAAGGEEDPASEAPVEPVAKEMESEARVDTAVSAQEEKTEEKAKEPAMSPSDAEASPSSDAENSTKKNQPE